MAHLTTALVRAGLSEPVLDVEPFTLTYTDAFALMRDLKAIGAHNAAAGRPPGLTGRGRPPPQHVPARLSRRAFSGAGSSDPGCLSKF